jgi:hypothetical protein
MDEDVQRSLGRIEGTQTQILSELRRLQDTLSEHIQADQIGFSSVRVLVNEQRQNLDAAFKENDRARNQHLNEQDIKLDALTAITNRAKGAGWAILGLIGLVTAIIAGIVIAAVSGVLKFKT